MSAKKNEITESQKVSSLDIDPVQQEQLEKQLEQACASLKKDIVDWANGRVALQEATMFLGWDIINLVASDNSQKVNSIIADVVASARRQKGSPGENDGLSIPSIYRRTGLLMRIIKSRGGLIVPVNMTFLRKNRKFLTLVTREELPKLAQDYPTSRNIGTAFPDPEKTNKTQETKNKKNTPKPSAEAEQPITSLGAIPSKPLIKPVVTSEAVMVWMNEIHERAAILGLMLKDARLLKLRFDNVALGKMSFFKRASAQSARECGKIIKSHTANNQGELGLKIY